jgi:hypothetical protein
MFQKTRIRSLLAIGALTGATVLGGTGLAGAESHPAGEETTENVENVVGEEIVAGGETGTIPEAEQMAPEEEIEPTPEEEIEPASDEEELETSEDAAVEDGEYWNHGQAVSAAAKACQEDHAGYDNRGQCVSEVARTHGAEDEQQSEEGVTEEQTSEETEAEEAPVEESDLETEEAPVEEAQVEETGEDVETQDADDQKGNSGNARS